MSDGAAQALADECQRQSENCGYTATTFMIWLRILRGIKTAALVVPVITGALATWTLLGDAPIWAAVFTLLTTVIPPAYKSSNVDEAIETYSLLGGEFINLRDRFRQAATIACQKPAAEFEAEVTVSLERLEAARRRMLTPPEWCFKLARRKHKKGHYDHDYDEQR